MGFNWKDPITKCSWQPIQLWPASYNWLYTTTHWSELKWYYITNYLQKLFHSLAITVKGHITHMIPSDEATIQSRERHAGQLATVRELGRMRWSCVETHVRRINGKIHEFMLRISRNILWISMDMFMDISTDIPKLLMTSTVSSLSQYLLCISLYSIYIYISLCLKCRCGWIESQS